MPWSIFLRQCLDAKSVRHGKSQTSYPKSPSHESGYPTPKQIHKTWSSRCGLLQESLYFLEPSGESGWKYFFLWFKFVRQVDPSTHEFQSGLLRMAAKAKTVGMTARVGISLILQQSSVCTTDCILHWGINWGRENVGYRLGLLSLLIFFLQDHSWKYCGSRIREREQRREGERVWVRERDIYIGIFDSIKSSQQDLSSKYMCVSRVVMHLHGRKNIMFPNISLLSSVTLDMLP